MDWMPQASTSAEKSDAVFFAVFGISVAFLLFITALMVYFVVHYRRGRHPRASQIEGHAGLEIAWTAIPLVVFVAIFYFGWTNWEYMRLAPPDAMSVKVTARQWSWSFEYPNGKQTSLLFAPIGRPMKLEVRSADVVHGFFVPAFRLKIDAVPGRGNSTWFQATRLGSFDIECTVICGTSHSAMLSKVVVVPEEEFRRWYFGGEGAPEPESARPVAAPAGPPAAPEVPGLALLRSKDCLRCHSIDGRPMVGPTFKGMLGRREEVIERGEVRAVVVDEQQIRMGIVEPGAQVVRGYPPAMPRGALSEAELATIVEYLKTLR